MRKVFPSVSYFFFPVWELKHCVEEIRGRRPRICDLFETEVSSTLSVSNFFLLFSGPPKLNSFYISPWCCGFWQASQADRQTRRPGDQKTCLVLVGNSLSFAGCDGLHSLDGGWVCNTWHSCWIFSVKLAGGTRRRGSRRKFRRGLRSLRGCSRLLSSFRDDSRLATKWAPTSTAGLPEPANLEWWCRLLRCTALHDRT